MNFWDALGAGVLSSALTLAAGWLVYWRSTRSEWRSGRVAAYTDYVSAVSALCSLGAFEYLEAESGSATTGADIEASQVRTVDRQTVAIKHAALNRAVMLVTHWGTNRAVAQAALINIALNERVMPLLLQSGPASAWSAALTDLAPQQASFVQTVRDERFRLW